MKRALIIFFAFSMLSACQSEINFPQPDLTSEQIISNSKPVLSSQNKIKTFSSAVNPSNQKIVDLLKNSSKGLTLVSESDEPFSVFVWSGKANEIMTPDKILKILNLNPKIKAGKKKEGVNWLKDYTTVKYWTDGGYSTEEAKKLATSYAKFMNDLSSNLKDIQLFLVDDPQNFSENPSGYDPSNDFSGAVGFYLFGKVGNDIVGVASTLVWT